MSNLKYKSNNPSTTTTANLPIWCSLSTPSQIARKYASIAPIWCHISRPRQLKKKFASTLHQAQNLLTRQHSKDTAINSTSQNNAKDQEEDLDEEESNDMETYKNSTNSAATNNIPASSSKNKINNNTNNTNNQDYDFPSQQINETTYDPQRAFLKKRDSSLDIKRENMVPSSSSSYLFNQTGSASSNKTNADSNSSRWNSSSNNTTNANTNNSSATNNGMNKNLKQFALNGGGKDSYDQIAMSNLVAALYDDSTGPTSAIHSHAVDGVSSSRRPNKYASSKYGEKLNGSKTEKILSKPSKSSPNLLTKDYDHLYTDKYDQNSQKWHAGNSYSTASSSSTAAPSIAAATAAGGTSSHHQYHSNMNPYLGNNYSNYNSFNTNYQPLSSSTSSAAVSTGNNSNVDNSNYSHYNSYANTSNSTREDKWNELDSMLGAQSALLSRLESDFVANRNKLKTNPSLNSISSVATTTQPKNTSSTTGILASKYNQSSNISTPKPYVTDANNNYRSYDLSKKHRTPVSSYTTNSYLTNNNNSTNNYNPTTNISTVTNLNDHSNNKKYFNYPLIGKLDDPKNEPNSAIIQKYTSKKTEPIIDLIKCLELNDEKRRAEELESANLASVNKNLTIETTINLKNYNNQPTTDENIDDFVDEFINDYFNNTLKSDINNSSNNNNIINSNCNTIPNLKTNHINNSNSKSNTNSNSSNTSINNILEHNLINNSNCNNNNNNVINTINSSAISIRANEQTANEINYNNNINNCSNINNSNIINNNLHNNNNNSNINNNSNNNSSYSLSNAINSDSYNQNWFVSITIKFVCFFFAGFFFTSLFVLK
jgi:hypothetical protein